MVQSGKCSAKLKRAKIVYVVSLLFILMFPYKVSARDVGAPNIDFSKGNFDGWVMQTGKYYRKPDSTVAYLWKTVETQSSERFHLVNSTEPLDDPIVSCDDFKENPFTGGAMTMRIGSPGYGVGAEGNGSDSAGAERATYKFVVTKESRALILNFACVLHDPTDNNNATAPQQPARPGQKPNNNRVSSEHSGDQIPHFEMNVEFKSPDGTLSTESCAHFASTANKNATYLKQPSDCDYTTATKPLSEYAYLPWTSSIYDLEDKIGDTVTITFQTHDCLRFVNNIEGAGGHEAYGYFYAQTTDLKLDIHNCESSGENAIIRAPKGFAHYDWRIKNGDNYVEDACFICTSADSSEVEIKRELMKGNSIYACIMRGELESCKPIILETELTPIKVTPKFDYKIECGGLVTFENKSEINNTDEDELFKYSWKFGDDNYSVAEQPIHKFARDGGYWVSLTAETKNGCSSTDSVLVKVPKYPWFIIKQTGPVCQGESVTLYAQDVVDETYSITWFDSEKNVISQKKTADVVIENSTMFYATVKDSNSCTYDDSIYINRVIVPDISLKASPDTVCSGDASSLYVQNNLSSCEYTWSNSATGENIKVYPVVTQTYKCTVKESSTGCTTSDSIVVYVNPSPVVGAFGPDELCSGEMAWVYGTGAENYEWNLGVDPSTGQNIIRSGDSMKIQPFSDTIYTVVGIDKYRCKGTASKRVKLKQGPLVKIVDSLDKVCPDQAASVTMGSAAGYSFLWQDGSTSSSLRKKISTNEEWKVKVTANGCTDSLVKPVYVYTLPLVNIVSKDEVCAFDTVKLTVAGNQDRIEWIYPASGSVAETIDIPDGPVEYQVIGYSPEGCPNIATKTVNVNIPVQVIIDAPDSVCVGDKAELKVQGNVESQRWYAGDTYFDYKKESSFIVREPVMFKLEGTDINGCTSKDSFLVDTISHPVIDIVGTLEVCPGDYVQVDAIGATEYEWHDGNKNSHRAFQINDEVQKVSVIGTRLGCSSQKSVILRTLQTPTLWIQGDSVICPGESTMLKAGGAETYSWGYGLDGDVLEVTPALPTRYTLTGIGSNGCISEKSVMVTFRDLPDVQIKGDKTVCLDSMATLVVSGAKDYYWSHGKHESKIVEKITKGTKFEVTGIDSFGCKNTVDIEVLPVDHPRLSYLGDAKACKGDYVYLLAQGATKFEWHYGNEVVYKDSLVFVPENDMYVKLVGTSLNCSSDTNIFIHSINLPNVLVSGNDPVCPGDKATITASGAMSYKWNTDEVSSSITDNPMTPTRYFVTGRDENGCKNTVAYDLKVYDIPKIEIRQSSVEGCADEGDRIKLTALGGIFYEWTAEPEPEELSSYYNSESMEITILDDTKFTLFGRDKNGCTSTTSKVVTLANRKAFDFTVTPGWIDENNPTVQFVGLSPIEAKWTWRPYSTAVELEGRTMNYRYNTSMVGDSVSVLVRAEDANGCVYEGTTSLYVWKDIWAPEAFTPNGDEKNDGFRFYGGRYVEEFSYIIYNRLGEIMYEGRGLDDAWDGKWNGKECPWGVYGWVYKYKCKFGNLERDGENRGFVTLVR